MSMTVLREVVERARRLGGGGYAWSRVQRNSVMESLDIFATIRSRAGRADRMRNACSVNPPAWVRTLCVFSHDDCGLVLPS